MNPKNSKLPLLAGAALIAILTLQAVQLSKSSQLAQRVAALEQGHRALQDSFLDGSRASRARLAADLGYHPRPRMAAGAGGLGPPGSNVAPLAPKDVYTGMRQAIAHESKDPVWAGNVQLNVRDVVDGLSKEGLSIPATPSVDCRSQHCLISFDLGEDNNQDAWIQQFLTEIAADLPQTQIVQVPSPDGSRSSLQILANRNPGTSTPHGPCPPGMTSCS